MYYCSDCGCEFIVPEVCALTHAFSSPPFEERHCCPCCGGSNFRIKEERHCRCCGAKLPDGAEEYCSGACRRRGEAMWSNELKRRRESAGSPLNRLIKEQTEYNLKHHTDYSYGQFTALIKPGLKRSKNERRG